MKKKPKVAYQVVSVQKQSTFFLSLLNKIGIWNFFDCTIQRVSMLVNSNQLILKLRDCNVTELPEFCSTHCKNKLLYHSLLSLLTCGFVD